ncbi:5-formyltetrahydrofolate cyclo-ligase [Mycobacterium tuberculosis CAS/NITR204]|uniref:5-formyltetrahydrofolate cyclo-ligase n=1 Tax=Mycobacterium tuberculosis CAS/NITR204 TaxID=1310114 RepID=R4MEW5_MYCTX|nr:5-formyltetrahydrofolate cyclo-ligase [Mycobacterium tuberculosis CAS/NITR204]
MRAAEARMLRGHLERMVTSDSTVCAYVPVGGEPGSIEMLDVLLRRAGRVLLPVARTAGGDLPLPLRWGEYRAGGLARARWGLLEPPMAAEAALAQASGAGAGAAADRQGVRWAEVAASTRSLRCRDPHARLVAVVRTVELVDVLPSEPHDVPMTHALTPERGLIALPCGE